HTLVVADPRSDLNPYAGFGDEVAAGLGTTVIGRGSCPVPALANATSIALNNDVVGSLSGRLFDAPPDAPRCFAMQESGLGTGGQPKEFNAVVVQPSGRGQIVSLGLPAIWTNGHLGEADNSVVAADLLAPRSGTRVAILQLPPGTTGNTSLSSLISVGVKL